MKIGRSQAVIWVLLFGFFYFSFCGYGQAASPEVLKAKGEAEAKGYIFHGSRDEILAGAKKEGKLRAVSSLPDEARDAMVGGFKKRYPFIDIYVEEMGSVEAAQRFLLEIKAGMAKGWDANRIYTEFYDQYIPYQKKFDILGMARHKILDIPAGMIDPVHRHIVAPSSNIHVVAYNNRMISPEKVPEKWEDFLQEEFRGRKFAAEIRPIAVAALMPAWGLEKTLDFARKIAARQPIWSRGHTRTITSVVAGEIPLFMGTNFGAVKRAQKKDRLGILGYRLLEPVSGRLHLTDGVLSTAQNPHAALLWLEFQASPEGQKILDETWPFGASVLYSDSIQAKELKGKKLSLIDWGHYTKLDEYTGKVVEAYGFPKVDKR